MSAKKVLDVVAVGLLFMLLASLVALWYNFEELERVEKEIANLKLDRTSSLDERLNLMIQDMERGDDRGRRAKSSTQKSTRNKN